MIVDKYGVYVPAGNDIDVTVFENRRSRSRINNMAISTFSGTMPGGSVKVSVEYIPVRSKFSWRRTGVLTWVLADESMYRLTAPKLLEEQTKRSRDGFRHKYTLSCDEVEVRRIDRPK